MGLTALHRWRDEQAAERDLPPGRVLANEAMLQLAKFGPTSFPALKRTRLRGWVLRELGDLIRTISDARDDPPAIPEPPARRGRPRHPRPRKDSRTAA